VSASEPNVMCDMASCAEKGAKAVQPRLRDQFFSEVGSAGGSSSDGVVLPAMREFTLAMARSRSLCTLHIGFPYSCAC
jgi:hypothetical protein